MLEHTEEGEHTRRIQQERDRGSIRTVPMYPVTDFLVADDALTSTRLGSTDSLQSVATTVHTSSIEFAKLKANSLAPWQTLCPSSSSSSVTPIPPSRKSQIIKRKYGQKRRAPQTLLCSAHSCQPGTSMPSGLCTRLSTTHQSIEALGIVGMLRPFLLTLGKQDGQFLKT